MRVTIRRAGHEDVPLLTHLIRESFLDVSARLGLTPEAYPAHPSFIRPAEVEAEMESGTEFYLAMDDGEVCGCAGLTCPRPGVCRLERLAVLPTHRRHGLGDQLIRHAVERAGRLGAHRLQVSVASCLPSLRRFYEKRGFAAGRTRRVPHLPFPVTDMSLDVDARVLAGHGR